MGLPKISFSFKEKAETIKERNDRRIVSIIVKDSTARVGGYELKSIGEIPPLNQGNTAYVKRAFVGNTTQPETVLLYALSSSAENLSDAFKWLERRKAGYIAGPLDGSGDEEIIAFVNAENERGHRIKCVVSSEPEENSENIIYAPDTCILNSTTIEAAAFCSYIAGFIAGTPIEQSCTYAVLEGADLPDSAETLEELESSIDEGHFRLFRDMDKIRIASDVNYMPASSKLHKIKYTDTINMIEDDIVDEVKENYIGKMPNSYNNKCILITFIQEYLNGLEQQEILEKGTSLVSIDIDAQRAYLKTKGIDTENMTDKQVKEYEDTDENVFLLIEGNIYSTMEKFHISIKM